MTAELETALPETPSDTRRPGSTGRHLRAATRDLRVGDALAFLWLFALLVFVLFPGLAAPHDPLDPVGRSLLPASGEFWLGTDYLGRDLFSRIVYGTSRTLSGSLTAVAIGLVAGVVLGLVGAYFGRFTDTVIGRIIDVLLSIPGLLLSMVVVVALGFGQLSAAIAVGVANIAVFSRLMRSEVLTVRNLGFVEAAAHLGAGRFRVLIRHVLPNAYGSVLALSALQFGLAILWIASLSYLGYGAPPPEPEWGRLVSEGRKYIIASPGLLIYPATAIVLSVLAVSRVSHFIRRRVG
ncbi:ABC transporter permease [Gordonia rubripertincta]|uniref:ABC transporter permease n=1 Tax=Gordonia rubripertincta TaxID=36822 RepID=UPI000B8D7E36|nr:ABC transporter permease [Gordonia rubripertincta]ASR04033.1 Glutathione transport system permease protein GsiD [Gordonia rubripertincta]